jgi:hypothetical protein
MANRYWLDRGGIDSDNDGLSDEFERDVLGTDPTLLDTDGDGLNDFRERDFGSNPLQRDSDGDDVNDYREVIVGTNPRSKDTDGDTIDDRAEIRQGTASAPDRNRDGTADWLERDDADRDRLDDLEERWLGSKPNEEDSDFDGIGDFFEMANGWSPRSPVDDFRRRNPEVEIDIEEPLPDPGQPLRPGSGRAAMAEPDEQPAYEQVAFEQPGYAESAYDEPVYAQPEEPVVAADDGAAAEFGEFA